jgi:hypothetical protein
MSERPIAVLDSSVLIPHWSRLVLRQLAAASPPRFDAVWSTAIVAETWRVLTEQRLRAGDDPETISRDAHRMHARLDAVLRVAECSQPPAGSPPSPFHDVWDDHLWNAALNAGAQYIISHNTRDFPSPSVVRLEETGVVISATRHLAHGVEFMTAVEFVEDVLGESAALLYGQALPPGASVRSRRSRPRRLPEQR